MNQRTVTRDTEVSTRSFASCRSLSDASVQLLETFSQAEERAAAAWSRIGLADVDKRNKWSSFVEGRLILYINDFVRLQEAEEMALAAENDQLFRELFFASVRLKEPPQSKMLAQLVDAAMEHATERLSKETDDGTRSLLKRGNASVESASRREASYSAGSRSFASLCSKGQLDTTVDEMSELISLPSFVSVTAAIVAKGGNASDAGSVSPLSFFL
uniref:Uncharacterized protein TCIL3000_9_2090 n=1 Tax=Trypanosoma congolense (strain IL3000) TaxID=1068625 RepID=G0UTU8_TRYCI|nr:unnamed protein product [Trypanosoma congolense IL3000]